MSRSKRQRLQEFFRRLAALELAATAQEARSQIDRTLNSVEDELTDIPANPANWRTDGRLYPPQEDRAYEVPGFPEITRLRTLAHHIFIRGNGAYEFRTVVDSSGEPAADPRDGTLIFHKRGADGRGVWSR